MVRSIHVLPKNITVNRSTYIHLKNKMDSKGVEDIFVWLGLFLGCFFLRKQAEAKALFWEMQVFWDHPPF